MKKAGKRKIPGTERSGEGLRARPVKRRTGGATDLDAEKRGRPHHKGTAAMRNGSVFIQRFPGIGCQREPPRFGVRRV